MFAVTYGLLLKESSPAVKRSVIAAALFLAMVTAALGKGSAGLFTIVPHKKDSDIATAKSIDEKSVESEDY